MKNIIRYFYTIIIVLFLIGCSGNSVSDNIASNSGNDVTYNNSVSDDISDENADTDLEVNDVETRAVTCVDLAFELSDSISVYEYISSNNSNEYILIEGEIPTGTLIHAYEESSDGYYHVEYVLDGVDLNGYIKVDDSALVESEVAYTLSNINVQFELDSDYETYYGPSINYDKCGTTIEKGTVVTIVAIADNGWIMTEDGYFISNNAYTTEANSDDPTGDDFAEDSSTTSSSSSQESPDNSNTTTSTPATVVAYNNTTSNSIISEVDARDKINTFALNVYPENTIWGWDNSYIANNGKKYWACDGFAYMLSDYIFGNAPYTSIPVDISRIRIGDILTTTTNNGHRCVVIGVDMTTGNIFTADGNCDGKVTYKLYSEISEITGVVTRYSDTSWVRGQSQVIKVVWGDYNIVNPFNYQFQLNYYVYNPYGFIETETTTFYYADGSLDGGYWANICGYYEGDKGSNYYDYLNGYHFNVDNIYLYDAYSNTCMKLYEDDEEW